MENNLGKVQRDMRKGTLSNYAANTAGALAGIAIILGWILLAVGPTVAVVWIAAHFIHKYW